MVDPKAEEAVNLIERALDSLEPEAMAQVMFYLRGRLGATATAIPASTTAREEHPDVDEKRQMLDIRSLKEEKSARTAVEMAVLVAYYLQDEAPESERKDSIGAADLRKYFKQAKHPLPSSLGNTLTSAKNAGYLEPVSHGQYRLNAVGYNLIAHSMPAAKASKKPARRRTTKKTAAKKSGAKKTRST